MIVIDKNTTSGWCHVAANSVPELHAFAEKIGLKRCWFENKRGEDRPHYDLRIARLPDAVAAGAIVVSGKHLVAFLKANYGVSPAWATELNPFTDPALSPEKRAAQQYGSVFSCDTNPATNEDNPYPAGSPDYDRYEAEYERLCSESPVACAFEFAFS